MMIQLLSPIKYADKLISRAALINNKLNHNIFLETVCRKRFCSLVKCSMASGTNRPPPLGAFVIKPLDSSIVKQPTQIKKDIVTQDVSLPAAETDHHQPTYRYTRIDSTQSVTENTGTLLNNSSKGNVTGHDCGPSSDSVSDTAHPPVKQFLTEGLDNEITECKITLDTDKTTVEGLDNKLYITDNNALMDRDKTTVESLDNETTESNALMDTDKTTVVNEADSEHIPEQNIGTMDSDTCRPHGSSGTSSGIPVTSNTEAGSKLLKILMSGTPASSTKKTILPANVLKEVTEMVRKQYTVSDSCESYTATGKCAFSEYTTSETACKTLSSSLLDDDSSVLFVSECISDDQRNPPSVYCSDFDTSSVLDVPSSDFDTSSVLDVPSRTLMDLSVQNNIALLKVKHNSETTGTDKFCVENKSSNEVGDSTLVCDTFKDDSETFKNTSETCSEAMEQNDLMNMDVCCEPGKDVKAKQVDRVYDTSLLFSGELEKRRKLEMKKARRKCKVQLSYRKHQTTVSGEDTDIDRVAEKSERKPVKSVPNYFIAVQITNKQIKSSLEDVQKLIVSGDSRLKAAIIKPSSLHITLMVLSLHTEQEILKSIIALDRVAEKLFSHYQNSWLDLDIAGLGHFRSEVVFAKVKVDSQIAELQTVVDDIEEGFLSEELVSPDTRGFKPHITIDKMSKVKGSKKKGVKKIAESLYKDSVDTEFGRQHVNTIQLCSMLKPKDKQGYYHVEHAVHFGKTVVADSSIVQVPVMVREATREATRESKSTASCVTSQQETTTDTDNSINSSVNRNDSALTSSNTVTSETCANIATGTVDSTSVKTIAIDEVPDKTIGIDEISAKMIGIDDSLSEVADKADTSTKTMEIDDTSVKITRVTDTSAKTNDIDDTSTNKTGIDEASAK